MAGYPDFSLVTSRAPSTVPTGSAQILLAREMRGQERRCASYIPPTCSAAGCGGFAVGRGRCVNEGRGLCRKHSAKGCCPFGNCTTAAQFDKSIARGGCIKCSKHGSGLKVACFFNCIKIYSTRASSLREREIQRQGGTYGAPVFHGEE